MKNTFEDKNFVIVTHRLYPGACDDLAKYLCRKKCKNLWLIIHDFADLKTRRSHVKYYKKGKLNKTYSSNNYRFLPEIIVNLKDSLFTFFYILFNVPHIDIYTGLGAINAVCGCILRKIKKVDSVIFYTIDYVPKRFKNDFLNNFYHFLDKYALNHSSRIWNVSSRIADAREAEKGLKSENYLKQEVVPIGVWTNEISRNDFIDINKNELIFVGHLLEKQGIQMVLQILPEILNIIPDLKFRIIGSGEYEQKLKDLAKSLKIEKCVIFEGPIYNQKDVGRRLSKASIAIAVYDRKIDNCTFYADPTKLKIYLNAGLPIILTNVSHNAEEIARKKCGILVNYSKESIKNAVKKLLTEEDLLRKYRLNAINYAKKYDCNIIYDKVFFDLK